MKSILGPLYDSPTRTPEEQARVERLLGAKDFKDDTPFLSAHCDTNAKLLLFHLLGPLYLSLDVTDATRLHRTVAEQCCVERIIVEQKNIFGKTALHMAMRVHSFDYQRLLLKNLLGEFYVDAPLEEAVRPLHLQERIADMMMPMDIKGRTPLNCFFDRDNKYDSFELFLRNLLGDYFVEADGRTAKSILHRTAEENKFVYNVMITKSVYDNFGDMDITFGDKNKFKLLIEANVSYLHKFDLLKVIKSPWLAFLIILLIWLYDLYNGAPTINLVSKIRYHETSIEIWENLLHWEETLLLVFFLIIWICSRYFRE